jgi:hypothetical protein
MHCKQYFKCYVCKGIDLVPEKYNKSIVGHQPGWTR